ncbi:ABC transporter permease [Treponema parvum]|uniref:ABC transporter permease n=1 Tax=Treponema parvum TaxID=138851 RepID=A0A975ICK6_9SPIR|nr:ABC transporter permease [Treponema parvum]QTQ11189.1 ABC transporter permease [Treponema parvum]
MIGFKFKQRQLNPNVLIEQRFNILRTCIAVSISLVIAFVLIISVSNKPGKDMFTFLFGPFTRIDRFALMFEKAIPLLFTGVAVCLMYACGQINLAAEGAFFMGAFVCTPVAFIVGIPAGIHPVLCIIAGGIAGAVICGIPAVMHVKFGVLTVVSSLMINYVAMYLGLYYILNSLRDPTAGYEASYEFMTSARLASFTNLANIHIGLIIGILVVIGGYILMYKSTLGYCLRMIGQNQNFAKYSGIKVGFVIITVQLLAGFIAGAGGAIDMLGMYNRFKYSNLTNHGWDGIMIAVLARNNPKYVPLAVLFLSYIRMSADVLSRTSNVPTEVVKIIQAVVIIFVAAESFLSTWEHREIVKASQKNALPIKEA